jgi:antitoxin MazE
MQSEIKRWGNSAAVRIPKKLLNEARLDINTPVTMEVTENKIVIEARKGSTPKRLKLPFCEADLLAGLNPETAHADELTPVSAKELGD